MNYKNDSNSAYDHQEISYLMCTAKSLLDRNAFNEEELKNQRDVFFQLSQKLECMRNFYKKRLLRISIIESRLKAQAEAEEQIIVELIQGLGSKFIGLLKD